MWRAAPSGHPCLGALEESRLGTRSCAWVPMARKQRPQRSKPATALWMHNAGFGRAIPVLGRRETLCGAAASAVEQFGTASRGEVRLATHGTGEADAARLAAPSRQKSLGALEERCLGGLETRAWLPRLPV